MKNKTSVVLTAGFVFAALMTTGCKSTTGLYTRGVGIYPGNPKEDFSPQLVADNSTYRNIARLRPVYQSSAYDYNLTAQLATDGIITDKTPAYITITTNKGEVAKNEREWLFDQKSVSDMSLDGNSIWIKLELSKGSAIPKVTKISLNGNVVLNDLTSGKWQFTCSGSDDGKTWKEIGISEGNGLPGKERPNPFAMFARMNSKGKSGNPFASFLASPYGSDSTAPKASFSFNFGPPKKQRIINQVFYFKEPVTYHYYKVSFTCPCAESWSFSDWDFFSNDTKIIMTPSGSFTSTWMSAGNGEEWIYVDLGNQASFDNIKLHWVNKATDGSIQVSDDAKIWNDIASLPDNAELTDNIILKQPGKGRYVRVLMKKSANSERYILSELEIFGKGWFKAEPKAMPVATDNCVNLAGGEWKIQRASEVNDNGEKISEPGFVPNGWVAATVPGTVLVSYLNAGALPDPNFGNNQILISESYFNSDFWYRNEFEVPTGFKGKKIFLNFDGINWKADVFVNGKKAGRIEGAFIRGKFDVTSLVIPGQKNALAVRIIKNANIGTVKEQTVLSTDKNGGILGADNPTFHASVGWDWIPTIRGRNIGIWNDVYLSTSGPVTIEDPLVATDIPLPDTTTADISLKVTLNNHTKEAVSGTLTGKYGEVSFTKDIIVLPLEQKVISLNSTSDPSLHIKNPNLWWPKGYGKQNLYKVQLAFSTKEGISDKKEFESGIRKMTYDESNQILNMYINGRRFIGRGGNWGFPESNLRYRNREYDIAVGYHADMNFTMIRNWVGQTGDDEFFEACDRYGIMVWQDFWLANPSDGPDPENPAMFLSNAEDFIKRIRNHPSIGIYVGRNEGNPPAVIDTALRSLVNNMHPGLHYISNSAFGVVSGGGPYRALPVRDYFLLYGYNKFHSERGMPNVMTYESLKQTLPESALWPQNSLWGIHDYCLESAQSAESFNKIIETGFGKTDNAEKFTELAQWINYNGYRGMFEGRSLYRQGLLLWMSHSCWPSMVWQTYDYYFEPTAAYFGCKKACEPLHIQWNPVFDSIEVVNYSAGNMTGLIAKAQIYNMDGNIQWEKETNIKIKEDATVECFKLEFPKSLSPVHFIKLILKHGEKIISDNFYWRGITDGNYQALKDLPSVKISSKTRIMKTENNWILTTTMKNETKTPVLMIRLKVAGKETGERILPVFYSDNYVSLMPGDEKTISMRLKDEDTRGEKPEVKISGFNLQNPE